MAREDSNFVGKIAFYFGVVFAIVLGVLGTELGSLQQWLFLALVVVGIVIGMLNVTSEEVMGYLTASAILVFVSFAGAQTLATAAEANFVMEKLVNVLNALMVLFVPSTIVVALRAIFTLAQD